MFVESSSSTLVDHEDEEIQEETLLFHLRDLEHRNEMIDVGTAEDQAVIKLWCSLEVWQKRSK
jgi:hypothetical protein